MLKKRNPRKVAQLQREKPQKVELSTRFGALSDDDSRLVVAVEAAAEEQLCGMLFHLTDSKRMLASVDRMTAAGNEVKFGPQKSE